MKRAARSNERGDIEPCNHYLGGGSVGFKMIFAIDRDFLATPAQRVVRPPGTIRETMPSRSRK